MERFKKIQQKLFNDRLRHIGRYFSGDEQSQKLSILIVDDEKIHQLMLANHLKKMGYAPDIANNGSEALAMCAETAYDLIFMDVEMPVMDGIEATRHIINTSKATVPVIIGYTSLNDMHTIITCESSGMITVLKKPASADTILKTISEYLPVSRLRWLIPKLSGLNNLSRLIFRESEKALYLGLTPI